MMRTGTPAVAALCLICVAVFAAQTLAGPTGEAWAIQAFGLGVRGLEEGAFWQFLTHALLHGNLWHLLLNLAGLWFAGRPVERAVGSARLVAIFALSAIGGGWLQILLRPQAAELIGSSGAVFGILGAFCTIFAEREVFVLLFFVVPLRLRARTFGQVLALVTVFFLVTGLEPWIGHAAHLGGCVTGYLAARAMGYGCPTFLERLLAARGPRRP